LKNDSKSTVLGRNRPTATVPARRPATHGRPEGRLGHGLAARSSRIGDPCAARVGRAAAWSPRAGRRGGTLAGGPVVASQRQRSWDIAPWLSGGCSGQGERRRGSPRWWRDDGAERRLSAAASSLEGGSAKTPSSSWSCEGGEGGSKSGNGCRLVGLTVGVGGGTTTAAVGNAPQRAAVARSPAWTRGGSLGSARRRARGEKRRVRRRMEERTCREGGAGSRPAWPRRAAIEQGRGKGG
jgi:hypothetical protein